MGDLYANLGLLRLSERFAEKGAHPSTRLQRRLRDLESRVEALNLSPEAVHLAAEIAAFEPDLNEDRRISLITLVLISLAAAQEGSTRFPVTGPDAREPLIRVLTPLFGEEAESCSRGVGELVASKAAPGAVGYSGDDYKPLLFVEPFIYQQRIYGAERELASMLKGLTGACERIASDRKIEAAVRDVAARPVVIGGRAIQLSDQQLFAVRTAASSALAVISGGPGTGKTSIVLGVVRVMARLGIDPRAIALAAPTGKAAFRMGECVSGELQQIRNPDDCDRGLIENPPAVSTIHRLLRYSPNSRRFLHHRGNPLDARVVIVDESSMLDLFTMARLAEALKPGTRLVMLGDVDQLPSVTAGAILRDLLEGAKRSPHYPSVSLTRNYRVEEQKEAGGAIVETARAINDGNAAAALASITTRESIEHLQFSGVERLEESVRIDAFLADWYRRRSLSDSDFEPLVGPRYRQGTNGFGGDDLVRLRRLFELIARARILSITRVMSSGADAINARIHALALASRGQVSGRFLPGEPVIMMRNDYERSLFNGDQGIVLDVENPDGVRGRMAVFSRGDNFIAFSIAALGEDIEHCYAMTVHKAQGSEFDHVAIVIPERDVPILTREILYTAVTRARKSATLTGSSDLIEMAVSRRIERYCGLAEKLVSK